LKSDVNVPDAVGLSVSPASRSGRPAERERVVAQRHPEREAAVADDVRLRDAADLDLAALEAEQLVGGGRDVRRVRLVGRAPVDDRDVVREDAGGDQLNVMPPNIAPSCRAARGRSS
jgi:hypothetical protein